MIVYIVGWVQAHAKILALSGVLTGAVGSGALRIVTYVDGVDDRLDAVEQTINVRAKEIDGKLEIIRIDVSETRCITLTHAKGGDPLDCLYDD